MGEGKFWHPSWWPLVKVTKLPKRDAIYLVATIKWEPLIISLPPLCTEHVNPCPLLQQTCENPSQSYSMVLGTTCSMLSSPIVLTQFLLHPGGHFVSASKCQRKHYRLYCRVIRVYPLWVRYIPWIMFTVWIGDELLYCIGLSVYIIRWKI